MRKMFLFHCEKSEMLSNSMLFHLSTFKWIELYSFHLYLWIFFSISTPNQLVSFDVVFSVQYSWELCDKMSFMCQKNVLYQMFAIFVIEFGFHLNYVFWKNYLLFFEFWQPERCGLLVFITNDVMIKIKLNYQKQFIITFPNSCILVAMNNEQFAFHLRAAKKNPQKYPSKKYFNFIWFFTGIENKTLFT